MSDGGRERVSLGVNMWKSYQKWSVRRSAVRSIAWLDVIVSYRLRQARSPRVSPPLRHPAQCDTGPELYRMSRRVPTAAETPPSSQRDEGEWLAETARTAPPPVASDRMRPLTTTRTRAGAFSDRGLCTRAAVSSHKHLTRPSSAAAADSER